MKPATRLLLVAVAAGVLGVLAGRWYGHNHDRLADEAPAAGTLPQTSPAAPAGAIPARPGDPLADIRVADLDGNLVELAGIAPGRPLLVNVWASWCGPCIEEMPELQHYAARQGGTGIQVVGLALDTPEGVRAFLERVPVGYPILLDQPGPADASVWLGNTQGLLPYTVLIDAQRRVVRQKLGPFAAGEIEAWVGQPL